MHRFIASRLLQRSRGDHATVDRLSNNIFSMYKPKWQNFKKVTKWPRDSRLDGHATVGWLSNNFFQQKWQHFEKVAVRSRDSWRSRNRRPTVKQLFLYVSTKMTKFWKNCWMVTWQWSEVMLLSADRHVTSDECLVTVQRLFSKCCHFCWIVE